MSANAHPTDPILLGKGENLQYILPAFSNRHGLVTSCSTICLLRVLLPTPDGPLKITIFPFFILVLFILVEFDCDPERSFEFTLYFYSTF